jgi:hypothetical protein
MKTNKGKCLSLMEHMNSLSQYARELKKWPHLKEGLENSIK